MTSQPKTLRFVSFPSGKSPHQHFEAYKRAVYFGMLQGMQSLSMYCAAQAKKNLTDGGKIDRGLLRKSIEPKVTVRDSGTVVASVEVGASHGRWVEYGRMGSVKQPKGINPQMAAKAAWPPVSAIRDWVRRHVLALAPAGRTRSGRAKRPTDAQINSLAYLIGRAIYRRGIAPFPFLRPAFEATQMVAARVIQRSVNQSLRKHGL